MTAQCFLLIAIIGTTNPRPIAARESIRYGIIDHYWSAADVLNCTLPLAHTTNTSDHAHHTRRVYTILKNCVVYRNQKKSLHDTSRESSCASPQSVTSSENSRTQVATIRVEFTNAIRVICPWPEWCLDASVHHRQVQPPPKSIPTEPTAGRLFLVYPR
ncbi:hypothetical protein JVU11DRAFT_6381 [Chiua virens]|nr:hypothetical protein JVU11DRAFT_6381 [Chiua virens]